MRPWQRSGTQAQHRADMAEEARKKQIELFAHEREVFTRQKQDALDRLESARGVIGVDRATLLKERDEAMRELAEVSARLSAEIKSLGEQDESLKKQRDEALELLAAREKHLKKEEEFFGAGSDHKCDFLAEQPANTPDGFMHARDRAIGRHVLMKIAPDAGAESQAMARCIIEEARIIGRLQHPNILSLYDVGLDEKGRAFYTIKAAEGITLAAILKQLRAGQIGAIVHYNLRRLLSMLLKVCDAVAFAHSKGVAHHALSPECILIGEYGEVFVTGWELRSQMTVNPSAIGGNRHARGHPGAWKNPPRDAHIDRRFRGRTGEPGSGSCCRTGREAGGLYRSPPCRARQAPSRDAKALAGWKSF